MDGIWTTAMRKKYLITPDIIDVRRYHTKHFYLRERVETSLSALLTDRQQRIERKPQTATIRRVQQTAQDQAFSEQYSTLVH